MEEMPKIMELKDGSKGWTEKFELFEVKVYVPGCELMTDIINYGFVAPYLLVFEERPYSMEEAQAYADCNGLTKIAAENGGSVVFVYPTNEGGWKKAPKDLFASIMAESRISQYYQDGVAIMWDRFAKKWGEKCIRGGVHRTYLYGKGESADYIAENCLKQLEGRGLFGQGDITPVVCTLQNLSVMPKPQVSDILVISIGNSIESNLFLKNAMNKVRIEDTVDFYKDYKQFSSHYRRMVGHLEKEPDLEEMKMVREMGSCTVTTSPDNRGDDKNTKTHKIGYVAYYNQNLWDSGEAVPLVMCFHGGGDSAMFMASVSGWYQVAAEHDFLLVCVENHLNSTATETIELINELKQKYQIDSERIYATGFSMGGCKSWDLFQEYPTYFAAVAPMDATFEVGQNAYGEEVASINEDVVVPVFYVGGEKTPLPELPFQEAKCTNRMAYVLKVNKAKTPYNVKFDEQEKWTNPIWGIDGDDVYQLVNPERENSVLTLNLFESENGCCYSIFGGVSDQGHEVRHHSCEQAWKFLKAFRRLPSGELVGGAMEKIKKLYEKQ